MAINTKKPSKMIARQTCNFAQAIYRDTVVKTEEEVYQELLNAMLLYEQACKSLVDAYSKGASD